MTDSYLTAQEAAEKVGVTAQAVYVRAESGKLRNLIKYGRKIFHASDVEDWRQERIAAAHEQIAAASE